MSVISTAPALATKEGVRRFSPLYRSSMPELDVIRGVVVLMVVFQHGFLSQFGAGTSILGVFIWLTGAGWLGVNLCYLVCITPYLVQAPGQSPR